MRSAIRATPASPASAEGWIPVADNYDDPAFSGDNAHAALSGVRPSRGLHSRGREAPGISRRGVRLRGRRWQVFRKINCRSDRMLPSFGRARSGPRAVPSWLIERKGRCMISTAGRTKSEYHARFRADLDRFVQVAGWTLQQKVALGCLILDRDGHESARAGQVSARAEKPGTFWALRGQPPRRKWPSTSRFSPKCRTTRSGTSRPSRWRP